MSSARLCVYFSADVTPRKSNVESIPLYNLITGMNTMSWNLFPKHHTNDALRLGVALAWEERIVINF